MNASSRWSWCRHASETAKIGCFKGICTENTLNPIFLSQQQYVFQKGRASKVITTLSVVILMAIKKCGASYVFWPVIDTKRWVAIGKGSGQWGKVEGGVLQMVEGDPILVSTVVMWVLRLGVATASWWRKWDAQPFSGVGGMMQSPQSLAFPSWLLSLPLPTSASPAACHVQWLKGNGMSVHAWWVLFKLVH